MAVHERETEKENMTMAEREKEAVTVAKGRRK